MNWSVAAMISLLIGALLLLAGGLNTYIALGIQAIGTSLIFLLTGILSELHHGRK